jgi:hypothetical protein
VPHSPVASAAGDTHELGWVVGKGEGVGHGGPFYPLPQS